MRASGKIKRYFRIIDIIQESPHPTSKKVLDSLYNDGFDISERTLQRSLKDLRNEFFINVQFNRSRGAYELMESEEEYVQQLLKFFKLSYQAETLSSSLGQSKKLSEHVSYDYNELIKGTEYIAPILQAIQKKTLLAQMITQNGLLIQL